MKFKELLNYLFDDNEITLCVNYKAIRGRKNITPREKNLKKYYEYKVDKIFPEFSYHEDETVLVINLIKE